MIRDLEAWFREIIWWRCGVCSFVFHDPDRGHGCENCGASPPSCRPFADDMPSTLFVGAIGQAYHDTQYGVVIALFCTVFEKLLNEFVRGLMTKKGFNSLAINLIEKGHRTIEARLQLFRALVGMDFKRTCEEMGLAHFYDGFVTVKKARDRFLHGGKVEFLSQAADKAYELTPAMLAIFANLHNKYFVTKKDQIDSFSEHWREP